MRDVFRPRHEPARMIYDAFQKEAKKRKGRDYKEWVALERLAVFNAAFKWAVANEKPAPTMADIESAEMMACGHVDYGSKWAYGVVDRMREREIRNELLAGEE